MIYESLQSTQKPCKRTTKNKQQIYKPNSLSAHSVKSEVKVMNEQNANMVMFRNYRMYYVHNSGLEHVWY